jgi:arginase
MFANIQETQHINKMAETAAIAITYVPADCGSVFPGKSKAPQAFRDADIVDKLRQAGYQRISEHHALEAPANYGISGLGPNKVRNEDLNVQVCQQVRRSLSQSLALSGNECPPPFQLILGGECGMSPGVLSAFWQHTAQGEP